MGLLAGIVEALTSQPAAAAGLAQVARLVATGLDADGCMVFRVQPDGDVVVVAAHPGLAGPAAGLRLPAGGVTGRVAADLVPAVLVDDYPRNPDYRWALGLAEADTVSRLCVPARLADGRCPAVVAIHTRRQRRFSPAEVATAQQVADLVALRVWAQAASELIDDYRHQWDASVASTVAAQEAERRRVANDLHDGVSQTIASLAFHLSAAQVALDDADIADARAQLVAARGLADLAFGETRSAIAGLHPPVLEDLGLAAGLASLARTVPGLSVDVEAQDLALPEHVAVSLYRVAQESINNVVKHAGASKVALRLVKHGQMVHLSIHDDGRGFAAPPAGPRPAVSPQAGYGLDGIAERVRLLGGVVQVRSAPGQGTTVEVRVPGLV